MVMWRRKEKKKKLKIERKNCIKKNKIIQSVKHIEMWRCCRYSADRLENRNLKKMKKDVNR